MPLLEKQKLTHKVQLAAAFLLIVFLVGQWWYAIADIPSWIVYTGVALLALILLQSAYILIFQLRGEVLWTRNLQSSNTRTDFEYSTSFPAAVGSNKLQKIVILFQDQFDDLVGRDRLEYVVAIEAEGQLVCKDVRSSRWYEGLRLGLGNRKLPEKLWVITLPKDGTSSNKDLTISIRASLREALVTNVDLRQVLGNDYLARATLVGLS